MERRIRQASASSRPGVWVSSSGVIRTWCSCSAFHIGSTALISSTVLSKRRRIWSDLDQQRDRPVVDEGDAHARAEDALRRAEALAEAVV